MGSEKKGKRGKVQDSKSVTLRLNTGLVALLEADATNAQPGEKSGVSQVIRGILEKHYGLDEESLADSLELDDL